MLINLFDYHKKSNTSKYKQRQISHIAEVVKDRHCRKKVAKATAKCYGKSNSKRISLKNNLKKSN